MRSGVTRRPLAAGEDEVGDGRRSRSRRPGAHPRRRGGGRRRGHPRRPPGRGPRRVRRARLRRARPCLAIAERAGVDPAMVNHWFGGKETLFTAAWTCRSTPRRDRGPAAGRPRRSSVSASCDRFLTIWDHTGGGRRLAALVRSVASHDIAARMMRQFVGMVVRRVVVVRRPGSGRAAHGALREPARRARHGALRAGAGAARQPTDPTVIAAIAPTMQRYLTGRLDGGGPPLGRGSGDAVQARS